jgi:hypothetical protein
LRPVFGIDTTTQTDFENSSRTVSWGTRNYNAGAYTPPERSGRKNGEMDWAAS